MLLVLLFCPPLSGGVLIIMMITSVCLSVRPSYCTSRKSYTAELHELCVRAVCDRDSVLLRRRRDTLGTSGFVDDVTVGFMVRHVGL